MSRPNREKLGPMAEADPSPMAFATVFVASDIATAHVVRATLEAEGIACDLPDEHLASLGWYLGNVIAGIRVQVDPDDLDRAKQVLAMPENLAAASPEDVAEALALQADRVAMRAWRLAVLSFAMWPFFHPYALVLGRRALKVPGLSADGRERARSAVRISVVSMLAFLAAVTTYCLVFGGGNP
jgi:Putative prokaryotic signal transducing protein